MGTNYYAVKKKPSNYLHIGKASYGWKFLFHEVDKFNDFDENLEIHTFEQWKTFLESNNDIVLVNEYDEPVPIEDFFKMVEELQKVENKNNFANAKNVNGYRFVDQDFR